MEKIKSKHHEEAKLFLEPKGFQSKQETSQITVKSNLKYAKPEANLNPVVRAEYYKDT